MALKPVGPERGRGRLRLVEGLSATDQMVAIVEEVLARHGVTTQHAADAVHLVRELDGLGLDQGLFFKALDLIDRKNEDKQPG